MKNPLMRSAGAQWGLGWLPQGHTSTPSNVNVPLQSPLTGHEGYGRLIKIGHAFEFDITCLGDLHRGVGHGDLLPCKREGEREDVASTW